MKIKFSRKLEVEMISVGLIALSHKMLGGTGNPAVKSRREGGGDKQGDSGCLWYLVAAFGLLNFCFLI